MRSFHQPRSRAYFGQNKSTQGDGSALRYIEVVNAHHLDTFNAVAGFDSRFVPLHHHLLQTLDRMFDHLKNGTPLPPSQVVRGVPREVVGDVTQPLELANLPPTSDAPGDDAIRLEDSTVVIPE